MFYVKFCYECGCKLEGNEEVCPECGEVFKNTQSPNDFMESTFNQFLEDIDHLKDNAIEFMKDVDIDDIFDDFSINSKKALNQDAFYVARARRKLENSGDNQRIIYLCNKALLVDEKNWEAYYLKGRALINLGRYDEAIDVLLDSLALNEDNLEAREYIAKASRLNGDLDYSLKVYDTILNVDDKYYEAILGKALVYFQLKDYAEANKLFEEANKISPVEGYAKHKWDFCLEKSGDE